jgi:beta-glucosidase
MQLGDYTHRDATERATGLLEDLTDRIRPGTRPSTRLAARSPRAAELARNEAAAKASQADIAIVALGDNSNYHGGIGWGDDEGGHVVTCGEGFDISSLSLPDSQRLLLEAVVATGTPVVLVMISGRPYDMVWRVGTRRQLCRLVSCNKAGHASATCSSATANPSAGCHSLPEVSRHSRTLYNQKSRRGYYSKPGH